MWRIEMTLNMGHILDIFVSTVPVTGRQADSVRTPISVPAVQLAILFPQFRHFSEVCR